MSDELSPNVAFENASQAYQLETARLTAVAQAQKTAMETNLIEQSVLDKHLANVRTGMTIAEYKIAISKYHQLIDRREKSLSRLHGMLSKLADYKLGDHAPGIVREATWASYVALIPLIPIEVMLKWGETKVPEECHDPNHWAGRSLGGELTDIHLPMQFGSLGDLVEWQSANRNMVVARFGRPPHLETLKAFNMLESAWGDKVAKLTAEISAIEAGHYDIWKPQDMIKLAGVSS